eukprot:TRINITY_DN16751_c0_g1_i2.p1 TRINITY_DN16751_c0_g1~~TRINITY_DN16751_c0_g1_i2.p1  ORF type:complete len:646 (+),score=120.91 TRINITY_DN16751_c0_g1_i2:119-2056(+)
MDKRKLDISAFVSGNAKRLREEAAGAIPDSDVLEATYFVEQHLVGWIIGKSGGTLKAIEADFQVKVSLDQSTKDQGYSCVRIAGPGAAVLACSEHINESLARAVSGVGDSGSELMGPFLLDSPPMASVDGQEGSPEELRIEQRFVGWLLGKSGGVVREIESASGCKISLNQDTRVLGYSRAQMHGTASQRAHARQLILRSLQRVALDGKVDSWTNDYDYGVGAGGSAAQDAVQVQQEWVGWLLGRSGGVSREIEQETGAKITIDQSTKPLGYSTVYLSGERSAVDMAKARIRASLQKVGATPLSDGASRLGVARSLTGTPLGPSGVGRGPRSVQVQIEQRWIGWLLGRSGAVIKEIEVATGAKVSLNQDTKLQGFSIATITAERPHAVIAAQDAITQKIRQVSGNVHEAVGASAGSSAPRSGESSSSLDPALARAVEQLAAAAGKPHLAAELEGVLAKGGLKAPVVPVQPQVHTMEVEQKWIGWLLGSRGKTMRDIEYECGATVTVDQSTKELGYSVLNIEGTPDQISRTQARIQASLNMAAGGADVFSSGGMTRDAGDAKEIDVQVEQRYVGWLLGKSGSVLREIEGAALVKISIDQSTREHGFSTVRIRGGAAEVARAKSIVEEKLEQADKASGGLLKGSSAF